MQPLKISMGDYEPYVYANSQTGEITFEGKVLSLPETLTNDYLEPLSDWVKEFSNSNISKSVTVNIRFSYFNTSAERVFIYPMFQLLEEYKSRFNKVKINWYYQSDDDLMLDSGEIFESITELDFDLIPVEKV